MIKTIKYFFFLSLAGLCIILGLWQIDRGNEKSDLYNSYTEKLSKNPIDFNLLNDNPKKFTNVIIDNSSFTYMTDKQFLLDNKVNNREAGYEVLTPVLVNTDILLVNRGWVTSNSRQILPDLSIKKSSNNIEGYIYYYSDPYELETAKYSSKFPIVIQNLIIEDISSILNYNVLPYVLILSKPQDNSYVIQSNYKANPEYKHYMYAGQWFLFAIIGLIFMVILMRKEK